MKNILIMLAVILLAGCAAERSETGDPIEFIPENSAVILKLQDPDLFFNNLKNNRFLKKNKDILLNDELQEDLEILDSLPQEGPAFLAFSGANDGKRNFVYITKQPSQKQLSDSLDTGNLKKIIPGSNEIQQTVYKGRTAYTATAGDILLLSNSTSFLEQSLDRNLFFIDSPDFAKALKAASPDKPVIFVNHRHVGKLLKNASSKELLSSLNSFSNWSMLNLDFGQTSLKFDGISTATDTLPKLVNVFGNAGTSESQLAALTPATAAGFYAATYKDFSEVNKNLESFRSEPEELEQEELQLLQASEEAGIIWLQEHAVFAIRSKDIEAARQVLSRKILAVEDFRGVQIFELSEEMDFDVVKPLLKPGRTQYFSFLSPFILFSETSEGLKEVITAFQNEQVLIKSPSYSSVSENLSSQSSLLLVTNNRFLKNRNEHIFSGGIKDLEKLDFEGYPLAALQLIYQDNFAHVHAVLTEDNEIPQAQQVAQRAAVTLSANVADQPYFFRNHRTNGLDVAVQDEQNTLYLISTEGKIHWKKKLDSRIIGEIYSVDLFKNGRIQLAFATPGAIHVIDKDGNNVKPFPLEFRDPITQPLAVFDYDNNRDYRFVIVQDRDIYMFNTKGERVRGFKFERAADEIINPLKHIRIGRKDYILAQEASGKLNILTRTGKVRVPVKEKLDFSGNEWYENNGNFVSTNSLGERIEIDQEGRVKKENIGLAETHKIAATEKIFVSLSENELNIDGNKLTLDFGLYTAPKIFSLNNRIYISTTDLQAQKVYVFDSKAQLLPGFPVYGNSSVDIGNADKDSARELVVKGEEDSVLVYEF